MTVRSIVIGIAGALGVLLTVAAVPATASAQFASGLTPPPPPVPAAVAAAAESTVVAKRDSVANEQRLDMKAWVDSAAGSLERGGVPAAPIPVTPGDTVPPLPPVPPVPPTSATPSPRRTPPPDSTRPPSTPTPPPTSPPATVPIRPWSPGITPSVTVPIRPSAPGITPPDAASSTPLLTPVGAGSPGLGADAVTTEGLTGRQYESRWCEG